jgi:hypothetical protein
MDMEQQDIQTGRTKRASQKNSRYKELDKHVLTRKSENGKDMARKRNTK